MAAAVVASVAGVGAGGGYAAAQFGSSTTPSYRGEARCYSVASLKGGNNFYGVTVAASGAPGRHAQVANALQTCTMEWQQGFLALGKPALRSQLPPAQRHVPNLVACVLPSGIAAVFPGNATTCERLGLATEEGSISGQ